MDDWTTDEIIAVSQFYTLVEQAYTTGVSAEKLLLGYATFQKIVGAKMYQKQLDKQFQKESGFSIYQAVKEARKNNQAIVLLD